MMAPPKKQPKTDDTLDVEVEETVTVYRVHRGDGAYVVSEHQVPASALETTWQRPGDAFDLAWSALYLRIVKVLGL